MLVRCDTLPADFVGRRWSRPHHDESSPADASGSGRSGPVDRQHSARPLRPQRGSRANCRVAPRVFELGARRCRRRRLERLVRLPRMTPRSRAQLGLAHARISKCNRACADDEPRRVSQRVPWGRAMRGPNGWLLGALVVATACGPHSEDPGYSVSASGVSYAIYCTAGVRGHLGQEVPLDQVDVGRGSHARQLGRLPVSLAIAVAVQNGGLCNEAWDLAIRSGESQRRVKPLLKRYGLHPH
jgi:hypothetical protein